LSARIKSLITFSSATDSGLGSTTKSTSIGTFSHSEGYLTTSIGTSSHSEGEQTQSIGNYSHAEGILSISNSIGSHAEGNNTISVGPYSHSEGFTTIAGWKSYNVYSVVGNVVTINSDYDLTDFFNTGKIIMDNKIYSYSSVSYSNPYFRITIDTSLNNGTINPLTYSSIDPTGFDVIFTGNTDDQYFEVTLPSEFATTFLGISYSSINVSTNGYVTFSGGSSSYGFNLPEGIPSSVGYPGVYLSIQGTDGLIYGLTSGYINDGNNFVIRIEGSYRNIPSYPANLIYNLVLNLK
jgi:hypothetical protein